jgi:hypothetical protein
MKNIKINMKQFRNKFKVYSDNVNIYENIINSKGDIFTLNPNQYIHWLMQFNIFYTET